MDMIGGVKIEKRSIIGPLNQREFKSNQLCGCGCEEYTYIAQYTSKAKGWIKGKPQKYINGHNRFKERVKKNTRKCSHCLQWKDLQQFGKDNDVRDGISRYCKKCSNKLDKFRREKRRDILFFERKVSKAKTNIKNFRYENRGEFTRDQLINKWNYHGGICYICREPVNEIDHIKPLSKGGLNLIANIRPICGKCNATKYNEWDGAKNMKKLIERIMVKGK